MKRSKSGVVFSSGDSDNTGDYSMNSSIDAVEKVSEKNNDNKINNIREQINQMFLANPELADQIKFEKFEEDKVIAVQNHQQKVEDGSPAKITRKLSPNSITFLSSDESFTASPKVKPKAPQITSKFWDVINREMTKVQKSNAIPPFKKINHILNIYKAKVESNENDPEILTMKAPSSRNIKSALGHNTTSASESRFKDLKSTKNSNATRSGYKGGDIDPSLYQSGEFDSSSGVVHFSFRKKMHLKSKLKREKMAQLQLESSNWDQSKNMFEDTFENRRIASTKSANADNKIDFMSPLNQSKPLTRNASRNLSMKPKSIGVIERLTRDFLPTSKKDEELMVNGKEFRYAKARDLYKQKEEYGISEQFKREAAKQIKQAKRDFYEKIQSSKPNIPESIKFSKDRECIKYNAFMPDFNSVSKLSPVEKEVMFTEEYTKSMSNLQANPQQEALNAMGKVFNGNIYTLWRGFQEQSSHH